MDSDSINEILGAFNVGCLSNEGFRVLYKECTKGTGSQSFVFDSLCDKFFLDHFSDNDTHFVRILALCNNLSIGNEEIQRKLLTITIPLVQSVKWNIQTATMYLMFVVASTQTKNRDLISVKFLLPFLSLSMSKEDTDDNDELDFFLLALIPSIAADLIEFALNNNTYAYHMYDLLHDSAESNPNLFDVSRVIPFILEVIQREKLSPSMARSNIIGIFAGLCGNSQEARNVAIESNAIKILSELRKSDGDDPAVLEWSVAALRFITQFVDPPENFQIFPKCDKPDPLLDEDFM